MGLVGRALGQMCHLLSEPTRQPSHVRLSCLHSWPGTESERTRAPWALCFCEQSGSPRPLCLPLGPPWRGRKELGFQVFRAGCLPNSVCFGEGFVFWQAIINSCSATQTTCQVFYLCLFTGQTVLSYRARETKSRMQAPASWESSRACLQCDWDSEQIHAAAVKGQAIVPFAVINTFHLKSSSTQRSRAAQLSISGCGMQVPLGWKLPGLRPVFLPE